MTQPSAVSGHSLQRRVRVRVAVSGHPLVASGGIFAPGYSSFLKQTLKEASYWNEKCATSFFFLPPCCLRPLDTHDSCWYEACHCSCGLILAIASTAVCTAPLWLALVAAKQATHMYGLQRVPVRYRCMGMQLSFC